MGWAIILHWWKLNKVDLIQSFFNRPSQSGVSNYVTEQMTLLPLNQFLHWWSESWPLLIILRSKSIYGNELWTCHFTQISIIVTIFCLHHFPMIFQGYCFFLSSFFWSFLFKITPKASYSQLHIWRNYNGFNSARNNHSKWSNF